MKFGGLNIDSAVLLAPMAGVADSAYRTVCRELGFKGLMFTEMVSAKGLCYNDPKSHEIAAISDAERPIGIQLFGSEPDIVARAVELLHEYDADCIDINMGCPMPKIVKNGEGAALMLDPERAQAVVEAVAASTVKPVSVKIRKGWDGTRINAVDFAKRLEGAGASLITVHGRTREQMYGGRADWKIVADVKQAVGIPVVGNGDIADANDAVQMFRETGCDGVMIGRAARGNPWLLPEAESAIAKRGVTAQKAIKDSVATMSAANETYITANAESAGQTPCYKMRAAPVFTVETIDIIKRHFELAVKNKGERMGVLEMRKHLAWYLKGIRGAAIIRNEIFRLTDYDGVLRRIENLTETLTR